MSLLETTPFDTATIVAKANALQNVLTGSFEQIRTIVDQHELVIAVWQDPQEKDGIGTKVVKGRRLLMNVIATRAARNASWTAIPCICLEQALALQQAAGEPELS